jgi:hypothetical protein
MPNYICVKCNKIFTQKGHYTNHLNKKFPCVPNVLMLNEKNEFVVVKLTNKHKLTDNEQKNELISLLTKNELKMN